MGCPTPASTEPCGSWGCCYTPPTCICRRLLSVIALRMLPAADHQSHIIPAAAISSEVPDEWAGDGKMGDPINRLAGFTCTSRSQAIEAGFSGSQQATLTRNCFVSINRHDKPKNLEGKGKAERAMVMDMVRKDSLNSTGEKRHRDPLGTQQVAASLLNRILAFHQNQNHKSTTLPPSIVYAPYNIEVN